MPEAANARYAGADLRRILASFVPMPESVCELCGAAPEASFLREADTATSADRGSEPRICAACRIRTYTFGRAPSHAKYNAALVRAIVMLKFERIDPLGAWFADRLEELARREGETLATAVVVPVPLHRQRERERGYNQADLIAKPLAKRLSPPILRDPAGAEAATTPGQANTEPYRAVGVRPWRFCHAAGQSG